MWREEIISVAAVDMAEHHKEACLFELEICISIDKRIIAELHPLVACFLDGELTESRTVVRRIVFGEKSQVGTQVTFQHLGNGET